MTGKGLHKVLVNHFVKPAQEKSVVRWSDCPDMTIAVDWDIKQQNQSRITLCELQEHENLFLTLSLLA